MDIQILKKIIEHLEKKLYDDETILSISPEDEYIVVAVKEVFKEYPGLKREYERYYDYDGKYVGWSTERIPVVYVSDSYLQGA
ncbi:MAG: hypothetical protein ACP5U0_09250 [Caldisphaera sp.]